MPTAAVPDAEADRPAPSALPAPQWYRHYKGGLYQLLHVATLESDLTPMVVYRAADGTVWIRPRAVFFEWITVDGARRQRFVPIDSL